MGAPRKHSDELRERAASGVRVGEQVVGRPGGVGAEPGVLVTPGH